MHLFHCCRSLAYTVLELCIITDSKKQKIIVSLIFKCWEMEVVWKILCNLKRPQLIRNYIHTHTCNSGKITILWNVLMLEWKIGKSLKEWLNVLSESHSHIWVLQSYSGLHISILQYLHEHLKSITLLKKFHVVLEPTTQFWSSENITIQLYPQAV